MHTKKPATVIPYNNFLIILKYLQNFVYKEEEIELREPQRRVVKSISNMGIAIYILFIDVTEQYKK